MSGCGVGVSGGIFFEVLIKCYLDEEGVLSKVLSGKNLDFGV